MILIDPPQWPAHGTVFSHLVSDTSLAELHAFAAAAGLAERAFDLDHYDVPERLHAALIAAGAVPVSGRELVRALASSGLRIKARHRGKGVGAALTHRWGELLPAFPSVGADLLGRWNEPHRHYHSAVHLLAVLEALDVLADGGAGREVLLAAWFHDAVYDGVPGRDEEASAVLAQSCLDGVVPRSEAGEVARLVRLTASHSPADGDDGGALLSDADLAVLGGPPDDYARYVAGVRADYAHVPDADFGRGRAAVLRSLAGRDPLFHTPRGRELWAGPAAKNLARELAQLNHNEDAAELPVAEFAFPGPLRDALVAAILDGRKTTTTGTLREYEVEGGELPVPGTRCAVVDSEGEPVAVIEITGVSLSRLADVGLQHAVDEGEGYTSVAQWRAGHEEFWHSAQMRDALGDPGFTVTDGTMLVLERFRLVGRLRP